MGRIIQLVDMNYGEGRVFQLRGVIAIDKAIRQSDRPKERRLWQ